MFGEHLDPLDEANELREAFSCFDEHDEGLTDAAELRYWLKEVGDRMSDDEVRSIPPHPRCLLRIKFGL